MRLDPSQGSQCYLDGLTPTPKCTFPNFIIEQAMTSAVCG